MSRFGGSVDKECVQNRRRAGRQGFKLVKFVHMVRLTMHAPYTTCPSVNLYEYNPAVNIVGMHLLRCADVRNCIKRVSVP